jgi:putative FmdB family regulatory protein
VPTYAYACTECGHRFEAVQSFTDDALTVCPECEGRLRKVFSNVGIVFKGSGFYRTDSRSDAKANGSKAADKGAEKSSEKSSEKGSDKSAEKSSGKGSDQPSERGGAGTSTKPDRRGSSPSGPAKAGTGSGSAA